MSSRHVGILQIAQEKFKVNKIALTSVRPFEMMDVVLRDQPELDPTQPDRVEAFLEEQVI